MSRLRNVSPVHAWALALTLVAPLAPAAARADATPADATPAAATVKAPASATTNAARPLTEEQKALIALEQGIQLQVADLSEQMKAARDGAARANLGRRVEQLKFDLRVQLLQTRLAFARKRGDLPAAQQIDATLAALLKPPATPIVRTVVQHPDKTVTGEGGQR